MLRNKSRWIGAVAFVGVPLIFAGCGGGGGSNGLNGTPTPTPVSIGFDVDATFSNATNVALPSAVSFTQGQGNISTVNGFNVANVSFGDSESLNKFVLSLSQQGTIQSGDSYTLSADSIGAGDKSFSYALGGDTYMAESGTFKVNSRIDNAATSEISNSTTIKFTLTNVRLRGYSNPSAAFTLNGAGQVTIQKLG